MCEQVCNYENYPTFTLSLYFSNTTDGAAMARIYINTAINTAKRWEKTGEHRCWNSQQKILFALEDTLKSVYLRDYDYDLNSQMLHAGYTMVNWREIAEDILNK